MLPLAAKPEKLQDLLSSEVPLALGYLKQAIASLDAYSDRSRPATETAERTDPVEPEPGEEPE